MKSIQSVAQIEMKITSEALKSFAWEDRATYSLWLAQTYHMVKHSTRLVALAAAYTDLSRADLHARFIDHAKEERGHELICVSDLKAMGIALDSLPALYPPVVMHQMQYYWIQHRGPVSFFGYILSLEVMAASFGPDVYKRAAAAHGAGAAKFLKVHSQDDVEHIEKAYQQLAGVPPQEVEKVTENLRLSAALYRTMLTEIGKAAVAPGLKNAA